MATFPVTPSSQPPPAQQSGPGEARPVESVGHRPFSNREASRQLLNVQVLQSSLEVSIQAGDQAQALLFRAAISNLNELLASEFGPNAIETAAVEDFSPAATAERILGFSTAFFDAYAAQHRGEDPEDVARAFVDLIRSGFEKGFAEAQEILEGLGVFEGGVKVSIMETRERVLQGLSDFLAARLSPPDEEAPDMP